MWCMSSIGAIESSRGALQSVILRMTVIDLKQSS